VICSVVDYELVFVGCLMAFSPFFEIYLLNVSELGREVFFDAFLFWREKHINKHSFLNSASMVNILSKRLYQVLVGCLVLSLLSATVPVTTCASETTYETNSWITVQYIGSAPGMDEYRGWDQDFGWTHTFNSTGKIIYDAQLTIQAWDVDSADGEQDHVYVDSILVGELTGENETWMESVFPIDPSQIYDDGTLNVWFDIDVPQTGFNVTIDYSQLRTHWDWIAPVGNSTDDTGMLKDVYGVQETVYVVGSGFPADVDIDIYVVPDLQWTLDMAIPADVSSDGINTVHTDVNGTFGPVLIWPSFLTWGEYDVVFDIEQDGIYTEYLEQYTDAVDDPNHPGFTVKRLVGGEILSVNPLLTLAPYIVAVATIVGTIAILHRKRYL
jgi:hypothetical protein